MAFCFLSANKVETGEAKNFVCCTFIMCTKRYNGRVFKFHNFIFDHGHLFDVEQEMNLNFHISITKLRSSSKDLYLSDFRRLEDIQDRHENIKLHCYTQTSQLSYDLLLLLSTFPKRQMR